ncbi:hypothetical protein L1987_10052 [Smallanthus sonchifolius]|uniref:Uncharacterized protein n=1 Tax=Smallanthus sonchifolius TaxID=185202 RepID=A0ACB9JR22_9ASTR|nr:hypothetical protein L1987_10052 [Smallanthus sonchifolius]
MRCTDFARRHLSVPHGVTVASWERRTLIRAPSLISATRNSASCHMKAASSPRYPMCHAHAGLATRHPCHGMRHALPGESV